MPESNSGVGPCSESLGRQFLRLLSIVCYFNVQAPFHGWVRRFGSHFPTRKKGMPAWLQRRLAHPTHNRAHVLFAPNGKKGSEDLNS